MEVTMTKIMLVEDDKSLREIYGVRLVAEGYQIVSAGDGEEALAMAIKEKPDLIISDVMMPKISGFDMLDILRSTPETKDMKVIVMTALSSEDQRARGEALGANKYLVKSQVGIEDVVRAVHDVLNDMPANTQKTSVFSSPIPSQTINTAPTPTQPTIATTPTNPQPVEAAPSIQQPTIESTAPVQQPQIRPTVAPPSQIEPTPMASANPVSQVVNRTSSPLPFMATPPVAQKTAKQPAVPPSMKPQQAAPISFESNIATNPTDQLPQPTAPFSSAPPASLGQSFAQNETPQMDIAKLMEQELNGTTNTTAPAINVTPVAPTTQPQMNDMATQQPQPVINPQTPEQPTNINPNQTQQQ